MIVIHGIMPGGSVVPECDRSGGPVITVGIFRTDGVLVQHAEKGRAFFIIPTFDAHCEGWIDVERLAAADGVTDD